MRLDGRPDTGARTGQVELAEWSLPALPPDVPLATNVPKEDSMSDLVVIAFPTEVKDKVLEGFKGEGGKVLKTSLDHTKEAALQAALAGVQAAVAAAAA